MKFGQIALTETLRRLTDQAIDLKADGNEQLL